MSEPVGDVPTNAPASCPGTQSDMAGRAVSCEGCPNQSICASAPKTDPNAQPIAEQLAGVKKRLLIVSGKGGVGKSTFSSLLARAMAELGPTGLLDLDLCGPSIPLIMGVDNETVHKSGTGWSPVYADEQLEVMSIGFLLQSRDDAVIWRGNRKNGMIVQFLRDVDWGELDVLLVDTPPGTSDEHLSAVKYLNADGAILVTTPQEVALLDVRRELRFLQKVGVPVIGMIENMSGFVCPHCGDKREIFLPTTGGAERLCKEEQLVLLGKVPLDPLLARCCDDGKDFLALYPQSPTALSIRQIVNAVRQRLGFDQSTSI